jgi:putative ABC transport system permease protein
MNIFGLSLKNIFHKPLSTALSLVLFALGVGLISILFLLSTQVQEKFDKNLAGIDLVIGAKGSPLQLILSSMYHIDNPTGNISIKEATPFIREGHPLIGTAIPLSLGDSYAGYRIVGTTEAIFDLYETELREGKLWEKPMEVVIGAAVALDTKLKIGDTFNSSHGFDLNENLVHDDAGSFKVVGILQPSGAVTDQLVLTPPESVWAVHDHGAHEEEAEESDSTHAEHHHEHYDEINPLTSYPDKDITAVLLKFKSRTNIQALNMLRGINENTDLLAASPPIEINKLYDNMGVGIDALRVLALVIVFVSGLSIFISLFSSLKERKYELALMRTMGASRDFLFILIILEGLLLAALGYLLGIALSHIGMEVMAGAMKESYRYTFSGFVFLREELILLAGALGIGFVAAIIPAIQASRTDISTTLSEG